MGEVTARIGEADLLREHGLRDQVEEGEAIMEAVEAAEAVAEEAMEAILAQEATEEVEMVEDQTPVLNSEPKPPWRRPESKGRKRKGKDFPSSLLLNFKLHSDEARKLLE